MDYYLPKHPPIIGHCIFFLPVLNDSVINILRINLLCILYFCAACRGRVLLIFLLHIARMLSTELRLIYTPPSGAEQA